MALEQTPHVRDVGVADEWLEIHAGLVAVARREVAAVIIDVRNAAAHAGGEVAAGGTDHNDLAVGHVLAAVVAYTFNHRGCPGVSHREALAGDAVQKRFA